MEFIPYELVPTSPAVSCMSGSFNREVQASHPAFARSCTGGPYVYITFELVPTPPVVSSMSGSSNFDSFRDGWLVAV